MIKHSNASPWSSNNRHARITYSNPFSGISVPTERMSGWGLGAGKAGVGTWELGVGTDTVNDVPKGHLPQLPTTKSQPPHCTYRYSGSQRQLTMILFSTR